MTETRGGSRWGLLRSIVGDAAAGEIVAARAGRTIQIPRRLREDHWLTLLCGPAAAAAAIRALEGARIHVPMTVDRAERDRAIRANAEAGASASVLAAGWGLSVRQIRNILRR